MYYQSQKLSCKIGKKKRKKLVFYLLFYVILESKGFFKIKAQQVSDDNLPGTVLVEMFGEFYEEAAWGSDPNSCRSCTRIYVVKGLRVTMRLCIKWLLDM